MYGSDVYASLHGGLDALQVSKHLTGQLRVGVIPAPMTCDFAHTLCVCPGRAPNHRLSVSCIESRNRQMAHLISHRG